jgi:hypothetical protein
VLSPIGKRDETAANLALKAVQFFHPPSYRCISQHPVRGNLRALGGLAMSDTIGMVGVASSLRNSRVVRCRRRAENERRSIELLRLANLFGLPRPVIHALLKQQEILLSRSVLASVNDEPGAPLAFIQSASEFSP